MSLTSAGKIKVGDENENVCEFPQDTQKLLLQVAKY